MNDLQRDGLAWAPDENRLFAITGFSYGSAPTLHVLPDAGKLDTTLSLQAPATSHKGKDLTVTGQLSAAEPFPAGDDGGSDPHGRGTPDRYSGRHLPRLHGDGRVHVRGTPARNG